MWNKKIVILFFCLSGCSYSTYYVPTERLVYSANYTNSVALSPQKTLSQPHKILGRVAAISWGSGENARGKIQEEAAKLGANLIIDLRIERGFGKTAASGLAVLIHSGEKE